MRITLVSAVFPPEPSVSAQTSSQLASELVARGHAVEVLAQFPNRPQGRLFAGYKRALYSVSKVNHGYTLAHCFSTFSQRSTMVSRGLENLSFGITSGMRLLLCPRPDVIYSNTWALLATGIVVCVARLRRVPVVLSVQDVYPESLEAQGRIAPEGRLYSTLRACDRAIAHFAADVIVPGNRFRRLYRHDRKVVTRRIHVVANWGNEEIVDTSRAEASAFRRRLGIPDDAFVAVYAGNIGVASNVELLVDVFAKLADHRLVYFVIAGDGSCLHKLQEKIVARSLDRFLVHSPWKTEQTGPVLAMADLLLLPTKGKQSLHSIPSKLISYFLAGRPVVAAVSLDSDSALAVHNAGAGKVVDSDSVDQMANAIASMSMLPKERLNRMGSAARAYALRNFTSQANLPHVVQIVEQAAIG
jgi:glycosyltransferase involved in cell wall biosynthesis